MDFKQLFLFLLIACALFCAQTCKNSVESLLLPENTDTTSHNFAIVRIDTLGGPFSAAYGADIVDESNIWVVGNFTTVDSTGRFINLVDSNYNAAHWNGEKWSMSRIPMVGYGSTKTYPMTLQAIKVFDERNIVVLSRYNSFGIWNGNGWHSEFMDFNNTVIHQMYARSSKEVYFVGQQGSVGMWNGASLVKMNSGTTSRLLDVWGDENTIYATGSGHLGYQDTVQTAFVTYNNGWKVHNEYYWTNENPSPPNQHVGGMESVFRKDSKSKLWLLGGLNGKSTLFEVNALTPFHATPFFVIEAPIVPYLIRGNADNDLFIAGIIRGQVLHFNGKGWSLVVPSQSNFDTFGFSVNGNLFVAVGSANSIGAPGIVVVAKR